MTTWHKRDWEQFYELARRPWRRHRPPRPVYPTGLNRVLPARGFSLSELDDAGVDLELAEKWDEQVLRIGETMSMKRSVLLRTLVRTLIRSTQSLEIWSNYVELTQ